MPVNPGRGEAVGGLRRKHQVVDTYAVVLGPGAGLVIPECVLPGQRVAGADGVSEAEIGEAAPGGAGGGEEERVLGPRRRIVHVGRRRDHVVVARDHQGFLKRQERFDAGLKRRHPVQLVGIFLGRDGVAVRQIEAAEADGLAALGGDDGLDIAGLRILKPGEAARHVFDRMSGEDRDAVIRLLPEGLDVVAEGFKFEPGKCLVEAFDFLEADDIGRGFLEPAEHRVDAGLDGIDVPGGDFHGARLARNERRANARSERE